MAKQTTRECVKALEEEGFENRGDGVWGVDLDIYDSRFTLFLSPTGMGNEYVVWWMEWNNCQQEGDDEARGTFKEMAQVAVVTKRLADAGEWHELGFEWCGYSEGEYTEEDLREDIKADVVKDDTEQMGISFSQGRVNE